MCTQAHIHTHVHMHACTSTYAHAHTYTITCTRTDTRTHNVYTLTTQRTRTAGGTSLTTRVRFLADSGLLPPSDDDRLQIDYTHNYKHDAVREKERH